MNFQWWCVLAHLWRQRLLIWVMEFGKVHVWVRISAFCTTILDFLGVCSVDSNVLVSARTTHRKWRIKDHCARTISSKQKQKRIFRHVQNLVQLASKEKEEMTISKQRWWGHWCGNSYFKYHWDSWLVLSHQKSISMIMCHAVRHTASKAPPSCKDCTTVVVLSQM